MQIVVTELPIEDAVGRARNRVDARHPSLISAWNRRTSSAAKYVQ